VTPILESALRSEAKLKLITDFAQSHYVDPRRCASTCANATLLVQLTGS
jgi:hypothetical protein